MLLLLIISLLSIDPFEKKLSFNCAVRNAISMYEVY